MLIDKHPNGEITKIKSWDVIFLDNEFSSRGEIDKEIQLYELNKAKNKKPKSFDPSGSSFVPQDEPSQTFQIWKSTCLSIPRRYFEIEGEVFMLALYNKAMSKSIDEALSSSIKEE